MLTNLTLMLSTRGSRTLLFWQTLLLHAAGKSLASIQAGLIEEDIPRIISHSY